MIVHPSRHFIYFQLSRHLCIAPPPRKEGEKKPDPEAFPRRYQSIIEVLARYGMPVPQTVDLLEGFGKDFAAVEREMRRTMPAGFNPYVVAGARTEKTKAFLEHWGITEAWDATAEYREAVGIFNRSGELRYALCVMTLGPVLPRDAASMCTKFFGIPVSSPAAKLFTHYFWNASIIDKREWKLLLSKEWLPGDVQDYNTALGAPRNGDGALLVVATALSREAMLSDQAVYGLVKSISAATIFEAATLPTFKAMNKATILTASLLSFEKAERRLAEMRGGSSDVVAELQRILQVYDSSKLPSILDGDRLLAASIIDTTAEDTTDTPKTEETK